MNARDEFFKLVNDLKNPLQEKSSTPANAVPNPVTEYWQQQNNWHLEALNMQQRQYTSYVIVIPSSPLITTPAQPPEC